MDKSSLEYWVKASKAGDQSAWNYIFKYVHPHLLNMALHICGNTPEAKDYPKTHKQLMNYIKSAKDLIKKLCVIDTQKLKKEDNKNKIKEYNERNKNKIKEYKKKYYENNKNKIKEHQKEYRIKNKNKMKEYSNQWSVVSGQ